MLRSSHPEEPGRQQQHHLAPQRACVLGGLEPPGDRRGGLWRRARRGRPGPPWFVWGVQPGLAVITLTGCGGETAAIYVDVSPQ